MKENNNIIIYIVIIILVVILGLKLSSKLQYTNVNEPTIIEEEVDVISSDIKYENITKKDMNDNAVVDIKQGESKIKKDKKELKEFTIKDTNDLIKKVKDETDYK